MTLPTADLLLIQRILREHDAPPTRLFGSWAKGTAAKWSDIDLCLCAELPMPSILFSRIEEALEESSLPRVVDLSDFHRLDPNLQQEVVTHGILIHPSPAGGAIQELGLH
ncbi:MAG: nucleotidyltransferase domain-containing protein [Fimbriimonadaceae bacterium]|nr:nucleotidyltransferase domain-containing protein [Fimbriimonadaceae bacterium]